MSFKNFRPKSEEEELIDPDQLVKEARDLAQNLGATEQELATIPNKPVKELRAEAESAISRLEVQELSRKTQELLIQLGENEAVIKNAKLSLQEISDELARLLDNFQE